MADKELFAGSQDTPSTPQDAPDAAQDTTPPPLPEIDYPKGFDPLSIKMRLAQIFQLDPLEMGVHLDEIVTKAKLAGLKITKGTLEKQVKRMIIDLKKETLAAEVAAAEVATDFTSGDPDHLTGDLPKPKFEPHEAACAIAFARMHRMNLRYGFERKLWRYWDGAIWRHDEGGVAVRAMSRLILGRINDPDIEDGDKARMLKASFTTNSLELAAGVGEMVVTQEDMDPVSDVIGSPSHMVDLVSGQCLPPVRSYLISKQISVDPADSPNHPVWDKFLDELTGGDISLQTYLQKFFGLCLTDEMSEEIVTFIYGPGGNGKGVLLKAISEVMHDYASSCSADVMLRQRFSNNAADIARLAGVHAVMVSEVPEDASWDTGFLKRWSGNEIDIPARHLYGNPFQFKPVGKLIIVGNHKPDIPEVDAAMVRRMRMIPLTSTPKSVDLTLKKRMVDAYPNIARWLIDGARKYREEGLEPPDAVVVATGGYLADQDVVEQFIEDCIRFTTGHVKGVILGRDLAKAAHIWARMNGSKKPSAQIIRKKLSDRGIDLAANVKHRGVKCLKGVQLKEEIIDKIVTFRKTSENQEDKMPVWSSEEGGYDYNPETDG